MICGVDPHNWGIIPVADEIEYFLQTITFRIAGLQC